jgi:hypothetical protein
MKPDLIISIVSAIVSLLGAIATIWALSLAKNQNNQAIAQTGELKQLTGEQTKVTNEINKIASELDRIQESLSTRYIGNINDYLPLVVNQLNNAEKSITILCDFPGYGYFSDPDNYKRYRIAIRNKIDNPDIKVSLMCLNESCRANANLKALLITKDNWEDWKRDKEHSRLLKKLGYSDEGINDVRLENFLNNFEEIDQEMLNVFCRGADIEEVNADLPFDCWLIDNKKAVFAFSTYAGDESQYGFFTLDEKLISAFAEIKDRYHRKRIEDENMERSK